MNLIEIINEISERAKGNLKPDLKKYGKNFRAISESAILETLNPLFKEYHIAYEVAVQDQQLRVERIRAGKDGAGNLIEKLVFIADAKVLLKVFQLEVEKPEFNYFIFEGWGSGVDAGDKATGKAITAATKYALLKGFRLQYSDDPDAEASEDIESIFSGNLEGVGVMLAETINKGLEDIRKADEKYKKKIEEEPLATEAQINYIKGLAVACGLSDEEFKRRYAFLPYDTNMPMKQARLIIEELKKLQDAKLPF